MDFTILFDVLTGKQVQKYYKDYMESQWFSRSELLEIQQHKLQNLMNHCYENVPYYQKVMKAKGLIPSDFSSLDTLGELPILTKEVIKSQYNDFTPLNLAKIQGVKSGQTGGTTGSILIKRNDAHTRSSSWGAFKRFEDWMGFKAGDKALILMGGHVIHSQDIKYIRSIVSSRLKHVLNNQIVFNPYSTDNNTTNRIIASLIKTDIKLIRGYSQYLYNLCQVMQRRGIRCHVPAITTTAEPLMTQHRDMFREVLGAEAYDQYGCGEIGGIAFECPQHEGLHITEERVIVEQNENNDLIVTDLDNYAMPFIRYYNADQAVIKQKKCSCGREHRLIEKVMGRTCDYVLGKKGEFLHWAYFWHLVFDSGIADKRDLSKFQIVQESQDQIIFRYVADSLSSEEIHTLTGNIQSRLGKVEVCFVQESDIPNTATGKYRPVVNKLIV